MATTDFRSTLEKLQAYEKPEALIADDDEDVGFMNEEQGSSSSSIQRYETARDDYLKLRTQQVFYEHLGTFDGESVERPEVPTYEEKQDMTRQLQEAQERLESTVKSGNEKYQQLQIKYDTFVQRREDVSQMIADMEASVYDENNNENDDHMDDDDDDDQENNINDVDLAAEEQKCMELAQRRTELVQRLARKRAELATKEQHLLKTKRELVDISNELPVSVTMNNIHEFEADTEEMCKKKEKYTEIVEWYDSMRDILEEVTGIKIVGVKNLQDSPNITILQVVLLGSHIVEVRMKKDSRRPNTLRVDSASFITSDVVTGRMVDHKALELVIPDLKDLVRLCSNMGPIDDVQFLLRETMGRIRAIVARVDELSLLRANYLTKIGALRHSLHSFGGEDQEVVCSIREGVTVVLRLTPDCPVIRGSTYVDQIVGVGGWDQTKLGELKETINEQRHRGPVKLMDSLKSELDRLTSDGEVSIPTTPKMPGRMAIQS